MIGWLANKSVRRLQRMLQAIRSRDFSFHVSEENLQGAERELAVEINEVMSSFRRQLHDQERRYGQYEAILDTIDTALIVAAENGDVRFMNRKAVKGLCGFRINRLSDLETIDPELPRKLMALRPGESAVLLFKNAGRDTQVKISMVRYHTEGEDTYIYTIDDINRLLLENEIEAQRKLVSVITHEIMNSLSPIISLSDTLCEAKEWSDEDALRALHTIRRRSQGLLTFVENYRELSRLAPPKFQWVSINEIFEGVRQLFTEPFITYEISDPDIKLRLDCHQMTQVLINLIKNGMESCVDDPAIVVSAIADHPGRRYIISVKDNGRGIEANDIDRIFVPFYTTKSGGSGIGLSLSRQIISSHGGTLRFEPCDVGSRFTIRLPLVYRL